MSLPHPHNAPSSAPHQSSDALDAARYRWLRNDNAYAPEEAMVWGGEDLDRLCDAGIEKDARATGGE